MEEIALHAITAIIARRGAGRLSRDRGALLARVALMLTCPIAICEGIGRRLWFGPTGALYRARQARCHGCACRARLTADHEVAADSAEIGVAPMFSDRRLSVGPARWFHPHRFQAGFASSPGRGGARQRRTWDPLPQGSASPETRKRRAFRSTRRMASGSKTGAPGRSRACLSPPSVPVSDITADALMVVQLFR
jgi:hypothetical protein